MQNIRLAVTVLAAAAFAASASMTFAAQSQPGGSVAAGTAATDVDPDGSAGGSVYDINTKRNYNFGLEAEEVCEEVNQGGCGSVAFNLYKPDLKVCTVNGSPAFINFGDPNVTGDESSLTGEPVSMECGRAYDQNVRIEGCTAVIQAHGFQHSDWPREAFLGPVPIEIRFTKVTDMSGRLQMTVWYPHGSIQVSGPTKGVIVMPTCE